jgi:hypothetical protein
VHLPSSGFLDRLTLSPHLWWGEEFLVEAIWVLVLLPSPFRFGMLGEAGP